MKAKKLNIYYVRIIPYVTHSRLALQYYLIGLASRLPVQYGRLPYVSNHSVVYSSLPYDTVATLLVVY